MSAPALAERFGRVAVAHEWLTVPGGSEQVVEAILALFPQADVFTTVYEPGAFGWLDGHRVHESALGRVPGARRHYPKLLGLMDAAWRHFDLSDYDLVVSSSHACAKNVRTAKGTVHVCYCHTPMRYLWDPGFLDGERLGRVGHAAFRAAMPRLRRADLRGVAGVDRFVANSSVVAGRIERFYGRASDVVHPPVRVRSRLEHPRPPVDREAPYLVFGRLVPYKRVDHAVQACARLGRRLVVAGDGRDAARLRAMGGAGASFVGRVGDEQMASLLASSRALLFPGEEDFGMVPVEAQAAGLPVIGLGTGGVRDSVVDGVTGVLYEDHTVEGLVAAIERFEALALDETAVRDNARRFGPERFSQGFIRAVLATRAGDRRPAVVPVRPPGSRPRTVSEEAERGR
ncbi:MAG: glycosyltransferase [Solirubrobacterales bacterium]|nr:glycosyltransferase [Solirubrobacterales bacterium]